MSSSRDWLSVIMEEYKTLYNEALTALQMQHSTLRFATAILSIILTAGAYFFTRSSTTDPLLTKLLVFCICFIVLATSCVVVLIWLHEVARMVRTTVRIKEIENEVNKLFRDRPKPLDWIKRVADSSIVRDITRKSNYIGIIFWFSLPMICAILVGYYVMQFQLPFYIIGGAGICFITLTFIFIVARYKEVKRYYELITTKDVNPEATVQKNA